MFRKQDKELVALADELGTVTAFSGLPRDGVEALAAAGRVVHLPSGWALIAEGTPADSVYVLLGGSTEVVHDGSVIATLTAGNLVGEAALVDRRRRNATVVAKEEVRALRLSYDDLAELMGAQPAIEDVFRKEWERKAAGAAPV